MEHLGDRHSGTPAEPGGCLSPDWGWAVPRQLVRPRRNDRSLRGEDRHRIEWRPLLPSHVAAPIGWGRASQISRQEGGERPPAAARHHQGLAQHGLVHLGRELPGDDARAHRGRDQRQGGPPARPQGERHHGPADPRRHGNGVLPQDQDPRRGDRGPGRDGHAGRVRPRRSSERTATHPSVRHPRGAEADVPGVAGGEIACQVEDTLGARPCVSGGDR